MLTRSQCNAEETTQTASYGTHQTDIAGIAWAGSAPDRMARVPEKSVMVMVVSAAQDEPGKTNDANGGDSYVVG